LNTWLSLVEQAVEVVLAVEAVLEDLEPIVVLF
jgi:hypothetical protein